jgi:magnesium-transporting ATPase (P-type)
LTRGRFQGIVSAVGSNSEIGKIHKAVTETSEQETLMHISLDKFGDVISKDILVICIITWVANITKFEKVEKGNRWLGVISFFKIAISLAVAAIPEGRPAVVTTTLSLGINRMAKQKAIVTKEGSQSEHRLVPIRIRLPGRLPYTANTTRLPDAEEPDGLRGHKAAGHHQRPITRTSDGVHYNPGARPTEHD